MLNYSVLSVKGPCIFHRALHCAIIMLLIVSSCRNSFELAVFSQILINTKYLVQRCFLSFPSFDRDENRFVSLLKKKKKKQDVFTVNCKLSISLFLKGSVGSQIFSGPTIQNTSVGEVAIFNCSLQCTKETITLTWYCTCI